MYPMHRHPHTMQKPCGPWSLCSCVHWQVSDFIVISDYVSLRVWLQPPTGIRSISQTGQNARSSGSRMSSLWPSASTAWTGHHGSGQMQVVRKSALIASTAQHRAASTTQSTEPGA